MINHKIEIIPSRIHSGKTDTETDNYNTMSKFNQKYVLMENPLPKSIINTDLPQIT